MLKIKKKLFIITAITAASVYVSASAAAGTGGVIIDSAKLVSEGIEVSLHSDTEENVKLYAAEYGSDGTLSKVVTKNATVTEETSSVVLDGVGENAKIFVWDENQKALCDIYTDITKDEEDVGDGIIHLNGDSINATGVENVSVDGSVLTITAAGDYIIEGSLNDGQIVVASSSKNDEINLYLNNVSVTNSTLAPLSATKGKVNLLLKGENVFTDTNSTEAADARDKGCITSKHDLTIKPQSGESGSLVVNGNYENGILCKADLEIGAVDITVNAIKTGIKGNDSIKFTKKAKNINITSGFDAIKTDSIPELVTDDTTGEPTVEGGEITINGGDFTIVTSTYDGETGDGIQADYNVTINNNPNINITTAGDGIKANASETDETEPACEGGNGNVAIGGGIIDIKSTGDGIKAVGTLDITNGDITIVTNGGDTSVSTASKTTYSCKGVKSGTNLNISGGNINFKGTDDAIHSNYKVNITGGTMELATGDDGVHADYMLTLGTEGGEDDDFNINITTSYEGVEGSVINILSGTTYLVSSDDGVNAAGDYTEDGTLATSSQSSSSQFAGAGGNQSGTPGGNQGGGPGGNQGSDDSSPYGMLYIKGGRTYCVVEGDGIDSNGSIAISGGVTIVNGPTSGGNGVFDKGDGNYTFTVTGGTLIGAGTTDMQDNPTSVTGQGYFLSSGGNNNQWGGGRPGSGSSSGISLTKGTPITINTSSGNIVFVPEITLSSAMLYVTCPQMQSGGSFSATTGGSIDGGTELLLKDNTYGAVFAE